jgi:transcriptional regulator GlxA family with amidase domain
VTKTVGIVLYPDFEELDAVGPYEVFGMLAKLNKDWRVVAIAEQAGPVAAFNGLKLVADHSFDDAPPLDVILLPGGLGSRRAMENGSLIDYVRKTGEAADWVTSVCTGAMVLHGAGFLNGRKATTHWGAIHELRSLGDVEVLEDARWVEDGNVITSAGVSAGIDMSLYLVSLLEDVNTAKAVQKMMEYYPKPPTFEESSSPLSRGVGDLSAVEEGSAASAAGGEGS